MKNPVEKIFELNKPFVYFHTHVIDQPVLDRALAAGKSLEVDMSMDKNGQIFIGHPLIFYEFKKLPPPANLPFDQVIRQIKDSGLYLVLDCKDARALPRAQAIIQDLGSERCLMHAWADALLFKPYPKEIEIEPHWKFEDLPLAEILRTKAATGVPLVISTRGLTLARLEDEGDAILDKIIQTASGKIDAVSLHLPAGEVAPMSVMQKLLDNGIMTLFNLDRVPASARPSVFIGSTDFIEQASDPKDFR